MSSDLSCKAYNVISRLTDPSVASGSASGNTPFGPAKQLKTLRFLRIEFDKARQSLLNEYQLVHLNRNCLSAFLICFMVFETFFSGLPALKSIFEKLFGDACVKKAFMLDELQDVVSYFALLAKLVVKDMIGQTKWLRHVIELLLKSHPGNEVLHQLFVEQKQAGAESLNARRCYESLIRSTSLLQPWLFAIQYESIRLDKHSYVCTSLSSLSDKVRHSIRRFSCYNISTK